MEPYISKSEAAQRVRVAKHRAGTTWAEIASAVGADKEWVTAALLGSHAMTPQQTSAVSRILTLDAETVEALHMQPYRGPFSDDVASDPTIYRFQEALMVYGPAIKELIHEEFGDGIMSAINFSMKVERREDPGGDRVVVTFDGKFLDYNW